jgi:hypothetical protein
MQNTDNQRSVSSSEPVIIDLHNRMGRLEESVAHSRLESARRDGHMALLKADVASIRGGQDKIYAGINRILWAVGLAVVGAATTFVMSGGFVIIQQH